MTPNKNRTLSDFSLRKRLTLNSINEEEYSLIKKKREEKVVVSNNVCSTNCFKEYKKSIKFVFENDGK